MDEVGPSGHQTSEQLAVARYSEFGVRPLAISNHARSSDPQFRGSRLDGLSIECPGAHFDFTRAELLTQRSDALSDSFQRQTRAAELRHRADELCVTGEYGDDQTGKLHE